MTDLNRDTHRARVGYRNSAKKWADTALAMRQQPLGVEIWRSTRDGRVQIGIASATHAALYLALSIIDDVYYLLTTAFAPLTHPVAYAIAYCSVTSLPCAFTTSLN